MNDRQRAKLAAYRTTRDVLDAHANALAAAPAAVRSAEDFRDALAALETAAGAQADYAPAGPTKAALRERMSAAAVPVAQATAAWATETGDARLAAQMHLTPTDFLQGPEQDALTAARLVHEKAAPHAAALADYNVSAERLATLAAATAAYAAALGEPRHAIVERATHTDALAARFDAVDEILEGRLDRLVVGLDDAAFRAEYEKARIIVDRGGARTAGPEPPAIPAG